MTVQFTEGLPPEALNDLSDTLSLLATRRSASAKAMREPGPSPEQLQQILENGFDQLLRLWRRRV